MRPFQRLALLSSLLASLLLAACGGGGGDNSGNSSAQPQSATYTIQESGAPALTGDTATDGFNWFNFRRQQLGLSVLTRNTKLNSSAYNHSNYQALNNVITHDETAGKPGFTGATLEDRLAAVGYTFTQSSYGYGEVISATSSTSGVYAAEGLITAIYHRFVIFEPMFKEAGAGAAVSGSGTTYFTTDFAADGLDSGLGKGNFVVYPFNGQKNVPDSFYSDTELPDPVANKDQVGFPISVHADMAYGNHYATVTVQSFTVQPHGGSPLQVQTLTSSTDSNTPTYAAAIIPLNPLVSGTTYDVQFVGTVDGVSVSRAWSFTTQ
jgi:uncharacterized protein YkwD